jgi:hypothetical protein
MMTMTMKMSASTHSAEGNRAAVYAIGLLCPRVDRFMTDAASDLELNIFSLAFSS